MQGTKNFRRTRNTARVYVEATAKTEEERFFAVSAKHLHQKLLTGRAKADEAKIGLFLLQSGEEQGERGIVSVQEKGGAQSLCFRRKGGKGTLCNSLLRPHKSKGEITFAVHEHFSKLDAGENGGASIRAMQKWQKSAPIRDTKIGRKKGLAKSRILHRT